MNKNKKTALYCRVSTDDQAEHGYSLREQERSMRQYIEVYKDDFPEEIVTYIDDGFSAKDLDRREMQMLISDIKEGFISKVVIHNLDRMTRSIMDLMFLIDFFEEHEVKLYSLKEKIDTDTAVGRFFVSIIVLMSQWERETISERTIRGMDQSAFEGNYVTGKPPFGYQLINKKLVIIDKEAAIVKQIYYMYYYEENSINHIYHYHASKHNEFDFNWSYDRIRRILNNLIYTGTYKNKRIEIKNHSPSIIKSELFEATQEMLQSRNRMNSLQYMFGRKCYETNTKENLIMDSARKGKKVYYYYYDRILNKRLNEDLIDNMITPWMDNFFINVVNNKVSSTISTLERQDREISFLEELFLIGAISNEYYIEVVDKMVNNIESKLSDIEDIKNNVQKWEDLNRNEKIKSVKYSIKRIDIDVKKKKITNITFITT